MRRLPGEARKVRGRVAGFVDRASCPDAKLARILASHPTGYSSTRPPPHKGTRKIKSIEPTARAAARHIASWQARSACLGSYSKSPKQLHSLTVIPAKAGIQCL